MSYRKPLKNGGSRMIGRSRGGQFAKLTLNAEACRHCQAFIFPELHYSDGFREERWPELCHRCGKEWAAP